MRVSRTVVLGVAAATALAVSVAGCGGKPSPGTSSTSTTGPGSATSAPSGGASAPTSAPAQPGDYAGLLIKASDIDAPLPFTGGPPTNNPNGQPGAAITFSTEGDSHIIKDTVQVLADPAAATNALNAAKANPNGVKNPVARPFDIGTGGTTVSGKLPDDSKSVLVLMFTEGRAFVTLEFDGPPESLPPEDFVTDLGQKQLTAVKKGLGG